MDGGIGEARRQAFAIGAQLLRGGEVAVERGGVEAHEPDEDVVRVALSRLFENAAALSFVALGPDIVAVERRKHRVERIELERLRLLGIAGGDPARGDQELSVAEEQQGIVGIDRERFFDQRLAFAPAAEELAFERSQHGVGLAHAGIDAERALRSLARILDKTGAVCAGKAQDFEFGGRERGPGAGKIRRFAHDAFKRGGGGLDADDGAGAHQLARFEIGVRKGRRQLRRACPARFPQRDGKRLRHFGGNFLLQLECVFERPVVALAPKHDAGFCFSQMRGNANAILGAPHRAIEHVRGVQRFRSLGFVAAAEGEARGRAQHFDAGKARDGVENFFREPVGERARGAFARGRIERQHGDDGLCRRRPRRARIKSKHTHRLAHFRKPDAPTSSKARSKLRGHALAHDLRSNQPARCCFGLQACGDVDAVAQEIAVLRRRHFAQMYAEPHRRFSRAFAKLDRRHQRCAGAGELQHDAVARGVENAPAVACAGRTRTLAQLGHMGDRLARIALGKRRIAGNVSRDDRGEPACRGGFRHGQRVAQVVLCAHAEGDG